MQFTTATNAWLSSLINKFALEEVRTKTWENPFSIFKKGNIPLGYHAGFHHANPAQLADYTRPAAPNYTDPFAGSDPVVFSDYLKVENDKIASTIISDDYLGDALDSWEKFDEFTQTIIGTLYTGNSKWEYDTTVSYLPEVKANNQSFSGLAVPTDEATAQAALITLMATSKAMTRISGAYTGRTGVQTFTDKANQILITTDAFQLAAEVYAKSVAFNTSYLDKLPRWETVESFGSQTPAVTAVLIDAARFQWRDKLFRVESIRNPADGVTVYWLRRRALVGNVDFANAAIFTA